ncbi:substrate-binding domain-containing protein [Rhizobium sp. YTU87027]|uniref:substrate-binding domain-containing protein n=1 Tax=Rhizobium sp. YTU87027 TaxID=3417741 RepID=UPI003D69F4DC
MTIRSMFAAFLATSFLFGAGQSLAETGEDLMKSRLGTTEVDPAIAKSLEIAAKPLTPELQAKALECWKSDTCDTGSGGKLKIAYADGFGENVWRRVTKMEFIQQALAYPEIGKIQYSSARGDVSKAIADMNAFIAQGVDIIVLYADAGPALLPVVREAKEAGITVVLNNGQEVGTAGEDYASTVHEDLCELGHQMVKAVVADKAGAKSIVALGGTPGNTLSSTWQGCAQEEADSSSIKILAKMDTNWTQEGTFQAVSAALAQYGDFDGWAYEYADGFRAAMRAYQAANKPVDTVVSLRTDEQGLFCDWEAAKNPRFRIYYSASGSTITARFAVTAAMMAKTGETVSTWVKVPFSMKAVKDGLCDKNLPMETPVSTIVNADTLKAMFPN